MKHHLQNEVTFSLDLIIVLVSVSCSVLTGYKLILERTLRDFRIAVEKGIVIRGFRNN